MDRQTDTRVQKMSDLIEDYLNSLNSIRETFMSNFNLLNRAVIIAKKSFKSFISKYEIEVEDIDNISPLQARELKAIIKKIERTELAADIFPQSMLVSLVSQYDYLIGQIIQFVYDVNPNLLNDSNSQISFKELFAYNDIEAIKGKIIQDKVETILRKSHNDQLTELQNLSGVKDLKGVSFWKEFIEITQRRNLLVHCKGCVSDQYINECAKVGISPLPCKGEKLTVDERYFDRAYCIFILWAYYYLK